MLEVKEEAYVKIGFIGAGHIGGNLARLAVKAGHEVLVSNSRNPKTYAPWTDWR